MRSSASATYDISENVLSTFHFQIEAAVLGGLDASKLNLGNLIKKHCYNLLLSNRGIAYSATIPWKHLGNLPELGGEQGGVDGPCPLEGFGVDRDVDQGIEPTDRANVARFGPLDAQVLGLAVDALAARALRVDDLVEGTRAVQQGAHQPTGLDVEVFDAALAFGKLLVLTALACAGGKEQRTAKALSSKAIGVSKRIGGMHAQACRAIRGAVGVAWNLLMAVTVEGDGGNATPMGHCVVDVPSLLKKGKSLFFS